jgi:hypothetical protein
MNTDKETTPSLRILFVLFAIIGVAYFFVPLIAMRPDGIIAAKPQNADLWIQLALHPLIGAAMIFHAFRTWRRYNWKSILYLWLSAGIVILGSPFTMGLTIHYGK